MIETDLIAKTKWLRKEILEMCCKAGVGHIASSYSCVEIIVALYYGGILKFTADNPRWDGRDRFILSKGHAGVALYPVLADLGFFPKDEIDKFCTKDGILGGHPDIRIPGIEITSGSLGHGLGIGTGLALSAKMDNKQFRTVVLMGDAELQEGSVWESAMFATQHKLDNLWAIVDRNNMGVTDYTEKYLSLEPLEERFESFGWEAVTIDGHNFDEILGVFSNFRSEYNQPYVIICNTVKGKGLSFMENNLLAHTMIPSGERFIQAKRELGLNV